MRKKALLTCLLVSLLAPCGLAQQKKRVAVINFDYGAVRSSVAAIFGTNQDVGKGISDLLTQKLVQGGKYSVVERAALQKIMQEQNLSNSDRADASTAAKIGRLLGADAIIVGTITQFGRDDKKTTVGSSAIGGFGRKFGLGGVQTQNAKAVVDITARLVDTSTAEILAAVNGSGESSRSGTSLIGGGGAAGSAAAAATDMTSSNFGSTILGEAVHKAVASLAGQLEANAATLPARKVELSGVVADVSGQTLIVNIGAKAGVKVGDTLAVSRPLRTVKDPVSGKVIKTIADKIGTATVTEVDADSATATFSGSGSPKVGDTVKSPQ